MTFWSRGRPTSAPRALRDADPAIVSQIALAKEVRQAETACESPRQRITFAAWVHAWRSFYRALVPDRDHERLLVVPFATAVRDMGTGIECVNARFGTDLSGASRFSGRVER